MSTKIFALHDCICWHSHEDPRVATGGVAQVLLDERKDAEAHAELYGHGGIADLPSLHGIKIVADRGVAGSEIPIEHTDGHLSVQPQLAHDVLPLAVEQLTGRPAEVIAGTAAPPQEVTGATVVAPNGWLVLKPH